MADPTNRADPTYSNDPNYVWSGGRWQYAKSSATPEERATAQAQGSRDIRAGTVDPSLPPSEQSAAVRRATDNYIRSYGGKPPERAGVVDYTALNSFAGYDKLSPRLREGANRYEVANPYQSAVADQSRAAQMALIQQMRAQAAGPSLAGMQGQRAMGQMGQQAIGQGGRGAMLGAQGAGAGLAADTGQARLSELMRMRAGMGGASSQLRGADLTSTREGQAVGQTAQQLADEKSRFYGLLGMRLDEARANKALEDYKLGKKRGIQERDVTEKTILNGLSALGGVAAAAV